MVYLFYGLFYDTVGIERRRPLGRPRRRWESNIKMDLQEVGWGGGGPGLD
jgi:hypothetical protein